MTRKDYIAVGLAISEVEDADQREKFVSIMVDVFTRDNERFDADRFIDFVQTERWAIELKREGKL